MRLADPPLWQYLLFEQPWPLVIALGAMAVVLTVVAQRRDSRAIRMVAWSLAIGAGVVYALAWQVTTDRQRLLHATEALVLSTESPMDVEHLAGTWLSDQTTLIGPGGEPWLDREAIERQLRTADQRHAIEQQSIRRLGAEVTQPGYGRSIVEVSTQAGGGTRGFGPLRTEWDLYWQADEHGQWRVQEIHWVSFRNQPPERRLLGR